MKYASVQNTHHDCQLFESGQVYLVSEEPASAWKRRQSQSRWSIEGFCEDERPTHRHHRLPWAVIQINRLNFGGRRAGGRRWSWFKLAGTYLQII